MPYFFFLFWVKCTYIARMIVVHVYLIKEDAVATGSLTIRVDNNLKDEAARIVEHYGLDLSSAVRAFFTQIVNTNAIPLSFDYEQPNAESLTAIRETDEMIRSGAGETYTTGRDLIRAAMA